LRDDFHIDCLNLAVDSEELRARRMNLGDGDRTNPHFPKTMLSISQSQEDARGGIGRFGRPQHVLAAESRATSRLRAECAGKSEAA
jgi:hypothetical protein